MNLHLEMTVMSFNMYLFLGLQCYAYKIAYIFRIDGPKVFLLLTGFCIFQLYPFTERLVEKLLPCLNERIFLILKFLKFVNSVGCT